MRQRIMRAGILVHVTSRIFIVALLVILTACGDGSVPSYGVSIKDLSIEMHVSSVNNQQVSVEAVMRNGPVLSGRSVYLSGSDNLIVSTIGASPSAWVGDNFEDIQRLSSSVKSLQKATGANTAFFHSEPVWYFANFDASLSNNRFTLIFRRDNTADSNATYVELPDDFHLTQPLSTDVKSRSGEIFLSWDNISIDTSVSVRAASICINGDSDIWYSEDIYPDSGEYIIPAGSLSDLGGVCNVTLQVVHSKLGYLDPAFSSGGIVLGHRIRSVVITTLP